MSAKKSIQLIILAIIFIIVGSVYFIYFSKEKIIVDQIPQQTEKEINTNLKDNNKNIGKSEVFNLTNIDESKKEKKTETSKIDLEASKNKETEKKSTKSSSNKKDTDMLNVVKK